MRGARITVDLLIVTDEHDHLELGERAAIHMAAQDTRRMLGLDVAGNPTQTWHYSASDRAPWLPSSTMVRPRG